MPINIAVTLIFFFFYTLFIGIAQLSFTDTTSSWSYLLGINFAFCVIVTCMFFSLPNINLKYEDIEFKSFDQRFFIYCFILGFIGYMIIFIFYGAPLLSDNPNVARVEIERQTGFIYNCFRLLLSISIFGLALNSPYDKKTLTILFLSTVIVSLTAFRGRAIEPTLFYFFAVFIKYGLSLLKSRIFLILSILALILFGFILFLTFLRFSSEGSFDFSSALDLLTWRLFYLNFENNIKFSIYELNGLLLGGKTYFNDFFSVINNDYTGFNKWFTELRRSENIQLFQTTPTFLSESIVNFGKYFIFFTPLLLIILYALVFCLKRLFFIDDSLTGNIVFLFTSIKIIQVLIPQGIGTAMFNYLPKIIISIALVHLAIFLFSKSNRESSTIKDLT